MLPTLRKYVIAGLLVWLPLAATVIVVRLVIGLLDQTILLLPPEYRPEILWGFYVPGMGLVLSLIILILTGMLAANLVGRRLVAFWEGILARIPLVRNIYSAVRQISHTLLGADSKSFRKVVMVQYPTKGIWSLGFLTNEHVEIETRAMHGDMVSVFIPTTPNPTNGYIVVMSGEEVHELEMSVEEAFKFIISMGVIVPEGHFRQSKHPGQVAHSSSGS